MRITSGDSFYSIQVRYLHGNKSTLGRPVTQLTTIIVAPGPDRAIARQRQGMSSSRCHTDNIGQALHLNRQGTVGRAAIAELTILVRAPCPDRTIRADCQAMGLFI